MLSRFVRSASVGWSEGSFAERSLPTQLWKRQASEPTNPFPKALQTILHDSKTTSILPWQAAKKYKLDAPSACKLAEVLECRDDPDTDLRPDS